MVRKGEKVLIRKNLKVDKFYRISGQHDVYSQSMSRRSGFVTVNATNSEGTRFFIDEDYASNVWNLLMVIDLKPFMEFLGGLKNV